MAVKALSYTIVSMQQMHILPSGTFQTGAKCLKTSLVDFVPEVADLSLTDSPDQLFYITVSASIIDHLNLSCIIIQALVQDTF